ncbi:hypothetical protein DE4585_00336 [Mycobacteroides salmoniphilum]|uniref:YokE-like PH domain-containing protein n=1 Tax=Mycobacteroides salmoniphilum TaxID=404941 RepID=A0A4R8S9G7_9MYCO|nr:hypothetical protein [Mycobacteroides salmoniphilum]TDZ87344.1 hypothetical protein DE4585_00336 [Mycobacteroides salmoniphilum]
MSNNEEVRQELVGDSGLEVRPEFVIGLRGVVRWPVRAFAVEYTDFGYLDTVYWIDGSAIGVYKFHSEKAISTVIRPLSAVSSVSVISAVDVDGFSRGRLHQGITIRFGSGGEEPIDADIDISDTDDRQHVSELSKDFIAAVLNAVAGDVAPSVHN